MGVSTMHGTFTVLQLDTRLANEIDAKPLTDAGSRHAIGTGVLMQYSSLRLSERQTGQTSHLFPDEALTTMVP